MSLSRRRLTLLMKRTPKLRRYFTPSERSHLVQEMMKHRSGRGITRHEIDRKVEKSLKKAGDPITHRQAKRFKKIMFNYLDTIETELPTTPKNKKTVAESVVRSARPTPRITFVEPETPPVPETPTRDRSLLPHRQSSAVSRPVATSPPAPTRRSPFSTPAQRLDSLRHSPIPPRRVSPTRFNRSASPPSLRPTMFSHARSPR